MLKFRHLTMCLLLTTSSLLLSACAGDGHDPEAPEQRRWLAGDHHIHSLHSKRWDESVNPPTAAPEPDTIHSIVRKARIAREHGLDWIVITDHGGREHARISLEEAYPDLLRSRQETPELIQFFGIELNAPGGDHNTVVMPHTEDEAQRLHDLEWHYDAKDRNSIVEERNHTDRMIELLRSESEQSEPSVVIANHPGKSVAAGSRSGLNTPAEFRRWNDAAPDVAIGMEGAPGHQAAVYIFDGSLNRSAARASYVGRPTYGGYDSMTAEVGQFWDAMLGEGRRWWTTATSDSHRHWTEGGIDFWPGEYAKTYVFARRSYDDVLDGLRNGRMFTVTGDLIDLLDVELESTTGETAGIGGVLNVSADSTVRVRITVNDPAGANHHGDMPEVRRIDVIIGEVYGEDDDVENHHNPTTRVHQRFTADNWQRSGERISITLDIGPLQSGMYLRVRGTNGSELEPQPDPPGEDPWQDLWFYSNPVFIVVE